MTATFLADHSPRVARHRGARMADCWIKTAKQLMHDFHVTLEDETWPTCRPLRTWARLRGTWSGPTLARGAQLAW